MRSLPALLCLALVTACGPKERVEDVPEWSKRGAAEEVHLELAETLLDEERPEAVLSLLAEIRRRGSDDPRIDLYHGLALFQQGLHDDAELLLEGARERMGRDPRPLRALALLQAETDRVDTAISTLRTALDLDSEHAATWNNLGFLLYSQQRHDEAEAAYRRAIALDGSVDRYKNNLGFLLAATGRYDQAMQAFRSAGSTADAHANLGAALELTGEQERAVRHYRQALEHDPTHATARRSLARLENLAEEAP